MEQNILKRYNEIHIMLWEEVLKVFSVRTRDINDIKYYKENVQLSKKLRISNIKSTALLHLFVKGEITEQEKDNLLMESNCSACYIAHIVHKINFEFKEDGMLGNTCSYCPIKKWRRGKPCDEYYTIEKHLNDLRQYIVNCINGTKKFNLGAYTRLRKRIMKKMYIVAHLEWRYEE